MLNTTKQLEKTSQSRTQEGGLKIHFDLQSSTPTSVSLLELLVYGNTYQVPKEDTDQTLRPNLRPKHGTPSITKEYRSSIGT